MIDVETGSRVSAVLSRLTGYCQEREWAGADPYDALNSEWLAWFPILDRRIPRLILTQCLKRSPLNLRPLLRIPPSQNPKALALFLSTFVKMKRIGLLRDRKFINGLVETLRKQRSPGEVHFCWGYSFPWQTRRVLVPRHAPNLVCTVFVANALLDVYETFSDGRCLEMALDAARYVHGLYWEDAEGRAGFGYPLADSRTVVHNANFLAAALLARVHRICHEPKFSEAGMNAAFHSALQQSPDGGWAYSETQPWIDNFHTGFNLCALKSLCNAGGGVQFAPHLKRGFRFYLDHFFREDGAPRYFHNRTYPIDTHAVAQSLITLSTLADFDDSCPQRIRAVLDWSLRHLWSPKGYFHYRAYPFWRIRTSYMRWSQAWMALALATVLEDSHEFIDYP